MKDSYIQEPKKITQQSFKKKYQKIEMHLSG